MGSAMDIKGIFLNVSRYDFEDEKTGRLVQGAKVSLAVPSDSPDRLQGYAISAIPALFQDYDRLVSQAMPHVGKEVLVSCNMTLAGSRPKLQALTIKAVADSKAA